MFTMHQLSLLLFAVAILSGGFVVVGVVVANYLSRGKHERALRELEAYERAARLALNGELAAKQARGVFLSPE
jgi:hypothetical protein